MADTKNSENMILRTIYLPRDLDQTLKAASIRGDRSKGEIMRDLILAGIKEDQKDSKSHFNAIKVEGGPVKPVPVKGVAHSAKAAGKRPASSPHLKEKAVAAGS